MERLDKEQLCALYCSPKFIRNVKSSRMKWERHEVYMGFGREVYRILVKRLDGNRPPGRPRLDGEHTIKVGLQEVGWEGVDWIDVAEDWDRWRALVNVVMNLPGSIK